MEDPTISKEEVATTLLQHDPSVFIHLDPRGEDVNVPDWFKSKSQLVLQIGLHMERPIHDLDVSDVGITATLSFGGEPHLCILPWDSIYALVGESEKGLVWPSSVPKDSTLKIPEEEEEEEAKKPAVKTKVKLPPYMRVIK